MKRTILLLMACLIGTASGEGRYTDLWSKRTLNGMGVSVIHQGDQIVALWLQYDPDTQPAWLMLQGTLVTVPPEPNLPAPPFSTAPEFPPVKESQIVGGALWRFNGPPPNRWPFDAFGDNGVAAEKVGIARLDFVPGASRAVLSYRFDDGRRGQVLSLERFSFGAADVSDIWDYTASAVVSDCQDGRDGDFVTFGELSLTQESDSIEVVLSDFFGDRCVFDTYGGRSGAFRFSSGTYACDLGESGLIDLSEIRITDEFITFSLAALERFVPPGRVRREPGCRRLAKIAGVRRE